MGLKMGITVLDARVIAQIAAGEVVERPASVVKELLENALDAGSNQVTIEIRGGGLGLIRVSDNGCGISDDQVEIAFERHATSKINSLVDLANLHSLGFRGEALPSIAAAARVEMLTSAEGAAGGSYIELTDGKVTRHSSQARAAGTTISVYNLFRQIPARLKFMKSENAEAAHIADIVTRYALAYPEVRISFINEGRHQLRTPGSGQLIDALGAVYGAESARCMLAVDNRAEGANGDGAGISVSGLTSSPQLTRATRDYLHFFVNRRWVNNRILGFALEEAYHGLLMQGKHPLAVINLRIPAEKIDVNVHPAKTEIKFQDERAVFSALQKAVRSVLVQSSPVHDVSGLHTRFGTPGTPFVRAAESSSFQVPGPVMAGRSTEAAIVSQAGPTTPLITLPLLRVLGQLACNYVVAEGPDGLYLIDQHAAHERVKLEQLRSQKAARTIEKQGLLPAETYEVEARLAAALSGHLEIVNEIGFEIEPFGPQSFMVRSIPAILSGRDWRAMLQESLDTLSADWAENLLNRLACHSAIRAGQVLSQEEMRELLRQLEKCGLPNSCPHGRPTMVHLSLAQIEKEFGRIT
jgi:DNA mismatch repair protein MutL